MRRAARAWIALACAGLGSEASSRPPSELEMGAPWKAPYRIEVAPSAQRACEGLIQGIEASPAKALPAKKRLKAGAPKRSDAAALAWLVGAAGQSEALRDAAREALAGMGPSTLGCVLAAQSAASSEGYAELASARLRVETRFESRRQEALAKKRGERR